MNKIKEFSEEEVRRLSTAFKVENNLNRIKKNISYTEEQINNNNKFKTKLKSQRIITTLAWPILFTFAYYKMGLNTLSILKGIGMGVMFSSASIVIFNLQAKNNNKELVKNKSFLITLNQDLKENEKLLKNLTNDLKIKNALAEIENYETDLEKLKEYRNQLLTKEKNKVKVIKKENKIF